MASYIRPHRVLAIDDSGRLSVGHAYELIEILLEEETSGTQGTLY